MASFPAPSDVDVQRVVDLVVDVATPLRVVVFGSVARGDTRNGSDLDLMVVVPDGVDEKQVAKDLYVAMARRKVGVGVDLIVATSARFEARKQTFGSVFRDIHRDGRELYAA